MVSYQLCGSLHSLLGPLCVSDSLSSGCSPITSAGRPTSATLTVNITSPTTTSRGATGRVGAAAVAEGEPVRMDIAGTIR